MIERKFSSWKPIVRKVIRIWNILITLVVCCILFSILKSCLGLYYSEMTHLSEDDLSWALCVSLYPNPHFLSNEGDTSVLYYDNLAIDNKTSPFYVELRFIDRPHTGVYIADLTYSYKVIGSRDTLSGFLQVSAVRPDTLDATATLYVDEYIESKYDVHHFSRPVILDTVQVGERQYTDCLIFSCFESETPISAIKKGGIEQFIISKKYGLIEYCYQDGRIFTRVQDEQASPQFLNAPY